MNRRELEQCLELAKRKIKNFDINTAREWYKLDYRRVIDYIGVYPNQSIDEWIAEQDEKEKRENYTYYGLAVTNKELCENHADVITADLWKMIGELNERAKRSNGRD